MTDAEREAQIRQELNAKDADGNSPAWRYNQYHASDIAFLLRLLDEDRTSIEFWMRAQAETAVERDAAFVEVDRLHARLSEEYKRLGVEIDLTNEARAEIARLKDEGGFGRKNTGSLEP